MSDPNWKPPNLVQPVDGYRHSADAFLLAGFAARFSPRFFCDLGTGSGVVAYALARATDSSGLAVERDAVMCGFARHNLAGLPVTVFQSDLRAVPWHNHCFDMVVANPPYFALGQGRLSQNPAVAQARHAFHGTVADFAATMAPTLRADGLFCFIFPSDRLNGVLKPILQEGWFVQERLLIQSYQGRSPRLQCLALSRKKAIEPRTSNLVMYRSHRQYTEDAINMLGPPGFDRKNG